MSRVPVPAHESEWANVIPSADGVPPIVETHVSLRSVVGLSCTFTAYVNGVTGVRASGSAENGTGSLGWSL
jgi:hypothetical protein